MAIQWKVDGLELEKLPWRVLTVLRNEQLSLFDSKSKPLSQTL